MLARRTRTRVHVVVRGKFQSECFAIGASVNTCAYMDSVFRCDALGCCLNRLCA